MAITFGKQLRRARQASGKTLSSVASFIGCSVPYLSDVELSRRAPLGGDKLRRAVELLNAPQLQSAAFMERRIIDLRGLTTDQRRRVAELVAEMRGSVSP